MENYLLSSPTQLSQPYDDGTNSLLFMDNYELSQNLSQPLDQHLQSLQQQLQVQLQASQQVQLLNQHQQLPQIQPFPTLVNNQQYAQETFQQLSQQHQQQQQQQQQFSPFQQSQLQQQFQYQYSQQQQQQHFQQPVTIEEEIVPASNNTNIQISKFFDDNKGDDEDIANSGNFNEFDHSRNISLDDTTITDLHRRENSINPPTGLPHSISSNTIYSYSSFESPQSHIQSQPLYSQGYHNQNSLSTPLRRNKSYSISSANFNQSPVNLATTAMNKIMKTPLRGHTRSRSKVDVNAAVTAAMNLGQATKSNSTSSYNSTLNPFYTPSQQLSSTDDDDISTPLLTPGTKLHTSKSTFFSPYTRMILKIKMTMRLNNCVKLNPILVCYVKEKRRYDSSEAESTTSTTTTTTTAAATTTIPTIRWWSYSESFISKLNLTT